MEPIGFSIGVLALISTFKDCIDLYSMIVTARSLHRDAETLDTKLEIEKMLFLQWADHVGLVKPNGYDKRLDDPSVYQAVSGVLLSVRRLLGEGKSLQEKYGLRRTHEYEGMAQIVAVGDEISTSRLNRFLRDFGQISIRCKMPRGEKSKSYSTKDKFVWVVTDRDKFVGLVGELSYFNSRLEALIPTNVGFLISMSEEDLSHLRNIPKLNLIVEATAGHNQPVVDAARRVINQNRILQRLWFRWIDDRRESVKEAHFKTLQWALYPPKGAMKWDDLSGWLQHGSGIYWLAGKPGSGKSTLMKYLHGHPHTRELLEIWTGESELVFADFFFYHLGKPEQKSQEGLLRGLLYQILSTNSRLIETALPAMWREVLTAESEPDYALAMPSITEMRSSILKLCREQFSNRKLFIMIDGLDEYDGRHMEVASFFRELGQNLNLKILIASRPEPAFVAAFGQLPKMHLQDLTRQDVSDFIDHTVTSHPYVEALSAISPAALKDIINDIASKASGVFLWVVLACRSVLEGFDDFDTIEDLKARIDELPPELEDLFRHLLSRIDGRHREQGVKLLRLVFDSQGKDDVDPIPTLGLALINEQGLRTEFSGPLLSSLPHNKEIQRCQMMEGYLRSRCCGLLEVQETNAGILGSRVVFMHRSVYDFLCMPNIWQLDLLCIDDENFNSHAILCRLWTQLVPLNASPESACVDNALVHGLCAEINGCSPSTSAINFSRLQVALVLSQNNLTTYMAHRSDCRESCKDLSLGLALAVEMGMVSLVKLALEQPTILKHALALGVDHPGTEECANEPSLDQRNDATLIGCRHLAQTNRRSRSRLTVLPMLYHATYKPLLHNLREVGVNTREDFLGSPTVDMVRYLLDNGHDPNEKFFGMGARMATTPWAQWLRYDGRDIVTYPSCCELGEITRMLLEFGGEVSMPGSSEFRKMKRALSKLARRDWDGQRRSPEELVHIDELWEGTRHLVLERLVEQYGLSAAADWT